MNFQQKNTLSRCSLTYPLKLMHRLPNRGLVVLQIAVHCTREDDDMSGRTSKQAAKSTTLMVRVDKQSKETLAKAGHGLRQCRTGQLQRFASRFFTSSEAISQHHVLLGIID